MSMGKGIHAYVGYTWARTYACMGGVGFIHDINSYARVGRSRQYMSKLVIIQLLSYK